MSSGMTDEGNKGRKADTVTGLCWYQADIEPVGLQFF